MNPRPSYDNLYHKPSYKDSKIDFIFKDQSGKPIIFSKSTKILPLENEFYTKLFYDQNYSPGNINLQLMGLNLNF